MFPQIGTFLPSSHNPGPGNPPGYSISCLSHQAQVDQLFRWSPCLVGISLHIQDNYRWSPAPVLQAGGRAPVEIQLCAPFLFVQVLLNTACL